MSFIEIGLVFIVPHRTSKGLKAVALTRIRFLAGYKIEKNALHSKRDVQDKRNEGKNRRGIYNIKS